MFLSSHTDLKPDRTISDYLRECLVSTKMELFIDTCCLFDATKWTFYKIEHDSSSFVEYY